MKTQSFIAGNMFTPSKDRACSSVVEGTWLQRIAPANQSWDKIFYSYGSHYPLLMRKANTCFVNDQGWSMTTCKHMRWAAGAVRDTGLDLFYFNNSKGENVGDCILKELQELKEKLPKLRSNAFRKKEYILGRMIELERSWRAYVKLFPLNS